MLNINGHRDLEQAEQSIEDKDKTRQIDDLKHFKSVLDDPPMAVARRSARRPRRTRHKKAEDDANEERGIFGDALAKLMAF
ncbi:hypothetical protein SPRG_17232 [Saprolegnia parasitica CBS 223.65]|uniref:Uncharacterized protein n=1 Tax=Saprolegnia parasitica (strain CBS 223.65) TaxID=695850 RepID=A0A067BRQ1_SAPPC|nr:hypothetical protein SPRG_17232 [Saprolegnia parasitica CBS 223.65]KDO17342.1 hypothetical protein SPRG_17232 [Saprolegnia parasitica CBS 223.65]|eukprot:XP_012211952.1 hypothetical protein SPRG_17232 [Saprolegnia parasitica CBS 223.65]